MERSSVPTNGYMDGTTSEMVSFFNDLAEKIGTDWKFLGRKLKVPAGCIESIDVENPKIKEKAFETLMKWYRMFGRSGATKHVLADALNEIGNKLLAEEIVEHDLEEINEKSLQRSIEETSDHQDQSSPEASNKITSNGFNDIEEVLISNMGEEFSRTLTNSQSDLANCDSASLVQRQKILQNLQHMDKILGEMMENYDRRIQSTTADHLLGETKKERRQRMQQTDQTIRLIQYLLDQPQTEVRNHRTRSEIPVSWQSLEDLTVRFISQDVISEINEKLQLMMQVLLPQMTTPRSSTYSPGSSNSKPNISRPIYITQTSTVERTNSHSTREKMNYFSCNKRRNENSEEDVDSKRFTTKF